MGYSFRGKIAYPKSGGMAMDSEFGRQTPGPGSRVNIRHPGRRHHFVRGLQLSEQEKPFFKKETEHKLAAVADLKAGEIVRWKTERLRDAEVFFRNPVFAALVRDFFARPNDSTLEKKLRSWMGLIEEGYDYDRVRLLDSRGVVRLSTPDMEEPLSPVIKQKVAETLQSRKITFVDFYRQEHSRKISLSFLVPIPDDRDGGRLWGCFP